MVTKFTHLILREELEQLRREIIENMQAAGEYATGKTAASMVINVDGGVGELVGRPYFQSLETGSKPWRNAKEMKHVPLKFADAIGEWIEAKGLNLNKWAVSRKIMDKGTRLYRQGGRDDVFTPAIERATERVSERLMVIYMAQFEEIIKNI